MRSAVIGFCCNVARFCIPRERHFLVGRLLSTMLILSRRKFGWQARLECGSSDHSDLSAPGNRARSRNQSRKLANRYGYTRRTCRESWSSEDWEVRQADRGSGRACEAILCTQLCLDLNSFEGHPAYCFVADEMTARSLGPNSTKVSHSELRRGVIVLIMHVSTRRLLQASCS